MLAVALKGLLGRKTRAILTSLAIVLGVAMVSGTFVLTDTIQKAFNGVFTRSYKNSSAIISGKEIVKGAASGNATVPAPLLAKVRALPDVAAATGGFLFDQVKLIDRNGKTIGGVSAPTFGFGVDPAQTRFNPLTLTAGTWASGPHQIVIDSGTAAKHHYKVGDAIGAAAEGPTRLYTISGIAKISGVSIGGATSAVFDVPAAQVILDKRGQFDSISAAAKPGVSDTRLAAEIRPLLPATVKVQTPAQRAKKEANDTAKGVSVFRVFLLAFAGIALFVGAFVIFNTISITVAQRAREFATLRTLGASRRQVLRSVLLESLVIGVLASVIGLFFGLALAKGLNAVFVRLGLDLPQTGMVVASRTVVISLLVGTVITLVAGVVPAIRATRIPPITAVREGAVLPKSRLAPYKPFIAGALVLLALLLLGDGLFASSGAKSVLIPLGAGTLLLFLGIAMVSSALVRPLAALVGQPARRFGGAAGRLAAENSVRNPGRTATTAAALMIGLALVTFVATLSKGLQRSDVDALNRQAKSDYVVSAGTNSDNGLFSAAAGQALAASPGVTVASSVRNDSARVFGKTASVSGIDGATIARVYHFTWTNGSNSSLPQLGTTGAIVDRSYAKTHHLVIGSPLTLETAVAVKRTFVVKGVYNPPKIDSIFSGILIAQTAFDRTFPQPKNAFTFLDVRGGAGASATAALKHVLASFPATTVQTTPTWISKRAASANQILDIFYVLLALSVIVSLFGMINTLILTVFERTRELGMLRAVGMTRIQMRRMVRHESVITALIGAALGLPLGVFLAALVTRGLSSYDVGFHLPLVSLLIFALIAVLAGTLAAVLPARRSARLNVLEALQYE